MEGDDGSLTGRPLARERRPGMRAVALAVSPVAKPIIAGHGGGSLGRLKAQWAAIAGVEFAAISWPEALGRDGALKLRVVPAHALELQHRMPLVIDRINMFFGRPVASRLVLVQGALPIAPAPPRPREPLVSAADSADLAKQLAPVEDAELREHLARLGRAIIAAAGPNE